MTKYFRILHVLFLFSFIVSCTSEDLQGLDPNKEKGTLFNCEKVNDYFGAKRFETIDKVKTIQEKYKKITEFGEGQSGARVYLVSQTDGTKAVLKIFPKHDPALNTTAELVRDWNYREIRLQCDHSPITYSGPKGEKRFAFPRLYDVGNIKTQKPFDNGAEGGDIYPYMLFEFVPGVTLADAALSLIEPKYILREVGNQADLQKKVEKAKKTKEKLKQMNFGLDQAHQKDVVEVFRLVSLAMDAAVKKFGTKHGDLHPGNVIVYRNAQNQLEVKIIDFGLGATTALPYPGSFARDLRPINGALSDFYFYVKIAPYTGVKRKAKQVQLIVNQGLITAGNFIESVKGDKTSDFNGFNIMIDAVNDIINPGNKVTYCETWPGCLALAALNKFEFGY